MGSLLSRLAALALVVALALVATTAADAATTPLRTLVKSTAKLPRTAVPKAKKRKLVRAAKHARKVAGKRPCVAVRDLNRFRRVLGTVKLRKKAKRRARARLAALGPVSLRASRALLASKRTKRCGGGLAPTKVDEAHATVLQSDTSGMTVRFDLPAVQFTPMTGGGQTWTKLSLPNTETPNAPGTPGIPVVSDKFAVPDGATVSVETGATKSVTMGGVDVFPAQPDPVDQAPQAPDFDRPPFKTPGFEIDKKAYGTDSLFPAAPGSAGVLGGVRDVTLGGVQVPAAQYNPTDGTLKVFQSVQLKVSFVGGTGSFSPLLASPWESPARELLSTLLNRPIIPTAGPFLLRPRCGEEMLVITNPLTRATADTFAVAKRAQGLRTTVAEVGTGPGQIGTTPAAIQTYIRGRLTAPGCIHPSYVTIMGDDDLVATQTDNDFAVPSDLLYSLRDDTDELPDVAVGRFIADNDAELATAVSKVIGYENSPPIGVGFTSKAVVAADFQDENADGQEDRTFVQFAETVRDGLTARGVDVQRVYAESPDYPAGHPLRFNDGTNLPRSLRKPHFAWDGSGADVTAGWNAGPFMVVHRDHGWEQGWGTPFFWAGDAQALTNGANLPVLFSVNCSSAAYDVEEDSFVGESLINPNGGSVGGFGDTRVSPTWHNTQIALGFVDALLPTVLPGEGANDPQRVGQALIAGKMRLAGVSSPTTDGNSRKELYLWHYFGDPSMQMWGGRAPRQFSRGEFSAQFAKGGVPGDPDAPYHVNVALPRELVGQPVSIVAGGNVVGKAIAGDGSAVVPADLDDSTLNVGDLRVAVDIGGAAPFSFPVDGTTSLTQTCPSERTHMTNTLTITGHLAGAPAGSEVEVTFDAPNNSSDTHRPTTTDANGDWSVSVVPYVEANDTSAIGTWRATSRYAGTADLPGAQAGPCEFEVYDGG